MYTTNRTAYRQILPGITIGFFVILGLLALGGVSQVSTRLIHYQWQYFALALLVSAVNCILRFFKKQYYFYKSGVKKVSIWKSLKLFLASFPLIATPYNIGESYKGLWLSKTYGLPVERAVSIYLVDHLFDGLSVFLISAFGSFAFPALWPLFLVMFLLFVAGIFFLKVRPVTRGFLQLGEKVPFLQKVTPILRKCVDTNPDLFKMDPMVVAFLLSAASWFAEGTTLYFVLLGFGMQASWPLVSIAIFIFSFSILSGIITNLPGGLGVVELSMTLLLTLFMGFRPEYAVAATVLFRLVTFWIGLCIGLIMWKFTGKSLGIYPREGRIIES